MSKTHSPPPSRGFYFVPELAKAKGLSVDQIYRLIAEGRLQAKKISDRRTIVTERAWRELAEDAQ